MHTDVHVLGSSARLQAPPLKEFSPNINSLTFTVVVVDLVVVVGCSMVGTTVGSVVIIVEYILSEKSVSVR